MFTLVYLCLPLFTRIYLYLPQFTRACLPMFTHNYSCLHMFTPVYPCLPLLLVFIYVARASLPKFTLFTRAYLGLHFLPMFTTV